MSMGVVSMDLRGKVLKVKASDPKARAMLERRGYLYHEPLDEFIVEVYSPEAFEREVSWLKSKGFTVADEAKARKLLSSLVESREEALKVAEEVLPRDKIARAYMMGSEVVVIPKPSSRREAQYLAERLEARGFRLVPGHGWVKRVRREASHH